MNCGGNTTQSWQDGQFADSLEKLDASEAKRLLNDDVAASMAVNTFRGRRMSERR